ncbi:MAG TPA: hypothetical protein VK501_20255 [Baekduia sp.]|uniref:hypothetical protein n=1 Tax=Baekduia sp. TaxID=2600305 RepID=UPI002C8BCF2E|nr:hypothetical protein [Baekduia sp.]HMJ36245.1 hypothetical protein [Baekduia sp.]
MTELASGFRGSDEKDVAPSARRSRPRRRALLAALGVTALALLVPPAYAGAATVTVAARDVASNAALPNFTYIVNADNARDPRDPNPLLRPSMAPTESNSPLVAQGDQDRPTVDLPAGRYLVTVRAPDHKMWGRHITLPRDAGTLTVALRGGALPLGKLKVFVYQDDHFTNSQPDEGEEGLAGFHVTLTESTNSQVSVDYNNEPLCGGDCVTDADGAVTISNLAPATYTAYVTPPDGSDWIQTSTFFGGFGVTVGAEEGGAGTGGPEGLPGLQLFVPPSQRTGSTFGFVHPKEFTGSSTATISGTARNWVGYPPFDTLVTREPVENPYVALSDTASDEQVYMARGDSDGNFAIPNVPPGTYVVAIWDEQLTYIMRLLTVTVSAGQQVDLGDVGVARWFGWLSGDVFRDDNGNGVRDEGESGIPNTDLDQRWRDGSIKETVFTDAFGRYEYPTTEGGNVGKFFIGEVGFARFQTNGASLHDEYDPSHVERVPSELGGGLLTNQFVVEGHRSEVDWAKEPYPQGVPGQIVGVTYWGTTRNEFDARFQAHEDYEPGVPDVTVQLEGLGADGRPNTADDPILNRYSSDKWTAPTDCDLRDSLGAPVTGLNPFIAPRCLEIPALANETKDGGFDGGYAFAAYCPESRGGFDHFAANGDTVCGDDGDPQPLVPGQYITHVLMPDDGHGHDLYKIVAEEDVNVDLGAQYEPAIPPPACTGDDHVVPAVDTNPRGPYGGTTRPLCDKRLVQLNAQQNANADFTLMTNQTTGTDVQIPGRVIGLASNNLTFERDEKALWYGEPAPVGHVPVGIRDYKHRLLTTVETDENGIYEAVLPSTETLNCPIPQGPCPGMYTFVVNDPGDRDHPNPSYDPNFQTNRIVDSIWPGQTTQLDTPVLPIAANGCQLPTDTPELLEVSKPYVRTSDSGTARRITIQGDFLGAAAGAVLLDNTTLTTGNGGIVSWSNRQIVIQVPALPAGPRQLLIRGANGIVSPNGITFHVLGSGYNPAVVTVAPPSTPHAIQLAIDAPSTAAGSLLVLQPGVYRENVILHKPLKLQGLGPGGIVGDAEPANRPADDPRFNVKGTVVDGRYFEDDRAYWTSRVAALAPFAGVDADHPVLEGADITVVAKTNTSYSGTGNNAARIDGLGITTGRGQGAGGIQLQAFARNVQITNDVLESDGGVFAGAIAVGQPYYDANNTNVTIGRDRIVGSGGLARAGGIGIFTGSNNYEIANNVVCSNYGVEYGAGISHWGLSPNGRIHDNRIYYNEAFDSGAGITISQETPQPVNGQDVLGAGTGTVDVDRNLIQANNSGDDGGGLFVMNAHGARINIRNNMITDNHAADYGGGLVLDDSSNVSIVNNTVANNVTSSSVQGTDDEPHAAGLVSHKNSDLWQATLPATAKRFSDPVALFNNIFWQNEAFTLSSHAVDATLVSRGFLDFGVAGTTGSFSPRYSLLTAGAAGQGNIIGQDPLFITPFDLVLSVVSARADPQMASVTITGFEPPVGLGGNYHLQNGSPAIDRGAAYSNFPAVPNGSSVFAPTIDFDGQSRPQFRSLRLLTPFDIGADEVPR